MKIAKSIISWTIIFLLFLVAVGQGYLLWHAEYGNDLDIRPYYGTIPKELQSFDYHRIGYTDMRTLVEKELNTVYRYKTDESEIPEGRDGSAHWYLRTVYMKLLDKYDNEYHYGAILAHELVHIKYVTKDEQWTTFKTITILLESESKVLHEVGKYYALSILTMYNSLEYGMYLYEYDVGAYIVEYFNK